MCLILGMYYFCFARPYLRFFAFFLHHLQNKSPVFYSPLFVGKRNVEQYPQCEKKTTDKCFFYAQLQWYAILNNKAKRESL